MQWWALCWKTVSSVQCIGRQRSESPVSLRGKQGSVTFPIATPTVRKRQNELKEKHMAVKLRSSEYTGIDLGFDSVFAMPPMLECLGGPSQPSWHIVWLE